MRSKWNTLLEFGMYLSPFLTRECENNERVVGHLVDKFHSLGRWAVNFNRAINLCILIYSFAIQPIGAFDWSRYMLFISRQLISSQGSYRSVKSWNVLEFCSGIFQYWKALEMSDFFLEICKFKGKFEGFTRETQGDLQRHRRRGELFNFCRNC